MKGTIAQFIASCTQAGVDLDRQEFNPESTECYECHYTAPVGYTIQQVIGSRGANAEEVLRVATIADCRAEAGDFFVGYGDWENQYEPDQEVVLELIKATLVV